MTSPSWKSGESLSEYRAEDRERRQMRGGQGSWQMHHPASASGSGCRSTWMGRGLLIHSAVPCMLFFEIRHFGRLCLRRNHLYETAHVHIESAEAGLPLWI
jgi:hypothetical protein